MLLGQLLSAKMIAPDPPEQDLAGVWALGKAGVNTGYSYVVAAVVRNEIYIYGGLVNNAASGRLIKYNPQTGKVTPLTSGVACYAPAFVAYKDKLYAFGGTTGSGALATARCYDPVHDKWTTLTAMPAGFYGQSHFVYKDKIYIVSGLNGTTYGPSIYCYDPAKNTYTTIAITSTNDRSAGCAFGLVGELFYMSGGQQGNSLSRVYDPAKNTWSTANNLPAARRWASGVINNKKLYVYGGMNTGFLGAGETPQNTFYALNPVLKTWLTLPTGTPAVTAMPMVVCYGRVYLIGVDIYRVA